MQTICWLLLTALNAIPTDSFVSLDNNNIDTAPKILVKHNTETAWIPANKSFVFSVQCGSLSTYQCEESK